jgi:23S rRNA (guanosine2251-2'-O)-methyltransferase
MREIVVIAHDIRSIHNVGSLLRTAEGLGLEKVYFTGYTPYPLKDSDSRLPHLANKLHRQIQKTALGAEKTQLWEQSDDIQEVINNLKKTGYVIAALEQTSGSVLLPKFHPPEKLALLLGQEVEGLDPKLLALCSISLEIPMFGSKESFNVVQAAAMALYHCKFIN